MKHVKNISTAVAFSLLSACGGSAELDAQKAAEDGPPRVVVAVIDSGTNPYHEFFNADGPIYPGTAPSSVTPEVLAAFGIDEAHIITPTRTGKFANDFAEDRSKWMEVKRGEPYWIAGTNVIAVTFDDSTSIPILPDDEGDTHGVSTSAAVLKANPEAILVFIEGVPFPNEAVRTIEGSTADSEIFAFGHPMIDIISTSYGFPFSPPYVGEALVDSYPGVVERGKLHIGAADNSPALSPVDSTAGPWWSIGIAGFNEGDENGKELLSGSLPDFIADFTQDLPGCMACERGTANQSGTSFATPRSAGTFSKVLLEARRALGHNGGIRMLDGVPVMAQGNGKTITNWQLRRAMEEAAAIPPFSDYQPGLSLPIPEEAPWTVAGWGVLSTAPEYNVVPRALAHLGLNGAAEPKPAGFCEFQTALVRSRQTFWNTLNPVSPSFGASADPFVYCDGALP